MAMRPDVTPAGPLARMIEGVILLCVTIGLWESCVRYFDVKSYLLPAPSDIALEMWRSAGLIWAQSLITLVEVLSGFAIAVMFAPLIAIIIYSVPLARRTLYPLIVAFQSIPKVGLAPIIIVWLGYGISSKIFMVFLFSFFPIVIATLGGLSGVPANLEEHFRALNAGLWPLFWRLRVPATLPNFIDGCKIAMPLAVIGAIVGEFVGSNDGLGNLILVATGSSRTALTFAALTAVTLLSFLLFYLIELIGKLVWWRAV